MSWFDAAGLANIAKSALKEAQRTIDKALDIKDDDENQINNPRNQNNEDSGTLANNSQSENVIDEKIDNKEDLQNTIWGSFTGSFFENNKGVHNNISLEVLDDSTDIISQHFSQSKLVIEQHNKLETVTSNKETNISNSSHLGKSNSPSTKKLNDGTLNTIGEDNVLHTTDKNISSDVIEVNLKNKDEILGEKIHFIDSGLKDHEQLSFTKNCDLSNAITVAPSRSNSQNLPTITDDAMLSDTQSSISKPDVPDILRSINVIDIPLDDDGLKNSSDNTLEISTDECSHSDKTLKSLDDQDSTSEESIGENRTLLKNLLIDEISDKDSLAETSTKSDSSFVQNDGESSDNLSIIHLQIPARESSPLSSDKFDIVKIGSDQTSGHTSGDEIETTTSSDIEIISSPNGDSSSTQSRPSPAKQIYRKTTKDECHVDALLCKMTLESAKGHTRELSEASSISDDSHSQEIEKFIRKITEMTEILESRESKIIEINRKNVELQELNIELKNHLDSVLSKQLESQDLTQVTEEYAQRMSALEKKFQQGIREKDTLRKQLEEAKQESALRLSKGEFDSIIKDKDEMIKQLREEGDKLSKQQLQHSNIIKKLRAKEKENETTIKQLKVKLEDLTNETDRMKRNLNAKEEIERSQIETVDQLTSINKKKESDLARIQSELDDQVQKYETLKKSLDAARKELSDKNKITNQLSAKEHMLESLENEKKVAESQNEEVINQLQYLRLKLHESENKFSEKEKYSRQENNELLKRLENAESRNEELSKSIMEISKPLVRQLESLQATYNLKTSQFEKMELEFSSKINELQYRLNTSLNAERTNKEECVSLRSNKAKLEVEYNTMKHQKELLEIQLEQIKTEKTILEQEVKNKVEEMQFEIKAKNSKIESLSLEISTLRTSFEEFQRNSNVTNESQEKIDDNNSNPRSTSPTLSVGKVSVADSLASSVWSQIESFDMGHAPPFTNMLEIQMLQSNLQQREGELQQLQWELNRREQERTLINSELTSLTSRVEELMKLLTDHETLKLKFEELQQQYDLLCQMYGEKVDEVEELKLDLREAKDVYINQLNELLGTQN